MNFKPSLGTAFVMGWMASVCVADPIASLVWEKRVNMPIAVQEIYPVALNNSIVVAGGFGVSGPVSQTMIFDAAQNVWRKGPDLPRPTHHIQLATQGTSVLAIGGYTVEGEKTWNMNAEVHRLNVEINEWVAQQPLPEPRAETMSGTINGTIIIAAGRTQIGSETGDREDHKEAADTLLLRPNQSNWQRAAPIPTPRMSGASAVLDGRLHVLGGRVHTGTGISYEMLDTHEAFDPATNSWSRLAPLPQPVAGIAAAVLGERLCVFGGEDDKPAYVVFDFLWCYNLATDVWDDLAPLPLALHGHGAVALDGRIHLLGGSNLAGGTGTSDQHLTFALSE